MTLIDALRLRVITHSWISLFPLTLRCPILSWQQECSESAVRVVNKHKFGAEVNGIIKQNKVRSNNFTITVYTLCEVTLHPSCTVLYIPCVR